MYAAAFLSQDHILPSLQNSECGRFFFHAACVIVVLVLLGRNEWMSDDSVALAYLFSDIIFSIAAYALMRKYC